MNLFQQPAKFPLLEKTYFARLFTLNSEFTTPDKIGSTLRSILSRRGLSLVGYRGPRNMLQPVDFESAADLFPLNKERLVYFVAGTSPVLQTSVLWFPPEVFDSFVAPRARLELTFGFPKEWSYEDAEGLFVAAVQALVPHWGELNRLAATKFPTLCTLTGHHHCVPHLGTTNYFGPEYCEFFGGIERIMSAGFQRVVPLCSGVLTSLGADTSPEVYKRSREEVEARLAPLETFDPNASVNMPRFRN